MLFSVLNGMCDFFVDFLLQDICSGNCLEFCAYI